MPTTTGQLQETIISDHYKRGKAGEFQHCKDIVETSSVGLDPISYAIFNVAAQAVVCRLHGGETPLLQIVSQTLFIQHTKHSRN